MANGWTDDPELVAIFRAEVDDKLAALREGLLKLESQPGSRQLIASLFRDAHTVKGSARALALESVVSLAHRTEDLLGALKDGRFVVRRDLVDVLLAAIEGIGGAMPGAERPVSDDDLAALVAALDSALAGADPVIVPKLTVPVADAEAEEVEPVDQQGRRSETVRVPIRRVYDLLDVVGEAELDARRVERTTGRLSAIAAEHVEWARALQRASSSARTPVPEEIAASVHALVALGDRLQAASRDLRGRVEDAQSKLATVREGAMGLAMVPVRRVVASFTGLVREVATVTGKDVQLVLEGEDVVLDTRVLDGVADALKHLVTNAVDHGCEAPAERLAAGKPARATVRVTARAASSTVFIEVGDDGAGIDEEALRTAAVQQGLIGEDSLLAGQGLLALMFQPGFTTRAEVTETSGRGVGLDVVRSAVEELGGAIEIFTEPGVGTRFVMALPVTLGVMRCLVARLGDERYALPVTNVVETLNLRDAATQIVAGAPVLVRHGVSVPLADLGTALDVPGTRSQRSAVVVRYGGAGEQLAWAVDALEGELELVVKDLGGFLGRVPILGGATIDGDGGVMLLLDLRELAVQQLRAPARVRIAPRSGSSEPGTNRKAAAGAAPTSGAPARGKARVLVVEDSVGVRELQRVILEGAGYHVLTAVDGTDGASKLTGEAVDLVLSDVEMPGMDGFTLTRQIRRTRGWENVPVVIMTSRGDDADKRAGLDAGANAYLLKSEFDQADLVSTVRRLVGR
jgi:chemotaxis protein histidine kinase CheA